MAMRFRVDVHGPGLTVWTSKGEAVEFQGRPMVRLEYGTIVDAADYHATPAEALRAAADRIDAIREQLAIQASELRAEAATEGVR
jgi:hypothetical protein